jgi:hypothetical protein
VPRDAPVRLKFRDDDLSVDLDHRVSASTQCLVLEDSVGREHHFGNGRFEKPGEFRYVATYGPKGRDDILWAD